jgi:molybdate transport system substrate-binding protein
MFRKEMSVRACQNDNSRPRQAKKHLLVCIRIAMLRRTALVLLLALTTALPAQAQDKTVTVYAAVSMKNALDDIDAAFTKTTGIKVAISLSVSSALAKAIEGGMPVDVFASADLDWMEYLD